MNVSRYAQEFSREQVSPDFFYTHIDKELKGNCRLVKIYQGTTLQGHALAVIDGRILSDGCILEESRISAGTGPFFAMEQIIRLGIRLQTEKIDMALT